MGLFDRFRLVTKSFYESNESKADRTVRDALRLIDEGNAFEEKNKLNEAMRQYETAVQLAPNLARAHLNLGNMLLATGDANAAIAAYTKAVTLDENYAAAHYNIGNAYVKLSRNEAAQAAYETAIQLKPDFVDAYVALGCVLEDRGHLDSAVENYRRALAIKPDYAEVHGNLGDALRQLGQFNDAAESFRRALEIDPKLTEAHINLGHTLRILEQPDMALASYHLALEVAPGNAAAHFAMGYTLKGLGKLDQAAESLGRALVINPEHVAARINLGDVFQELGRVELAIASYDAALKVNPEHAIAHNNRGNSLLATGQFDAAIASYRKSIEFQPDYAIAYSNLGNILKDIGLAADALVHIRRALELSPELAHVRSNLLFIHNLLADFPASQLLAEARLYGEMVGRQACAFTRWRTSAKPDRRLRIGLVSGDLRDHPVGFFVESVLHALASGERNGLEFHAYNNNIGGDAVSARIKLDCHGWQSITYLSDKDLAQRIYDDRIDILIDLSGHTAKNRLPLFAWKPAPVQVSWLGYFATTGVAAIDYLIADPWTLLESEEANFTEKIWRLPETRLCFTPPDVDLEVTPLPAFDKGYLTFACFNNLSKMNDAVVALWARVLAAVPASRLFLKTRQLNEASVRQSVIEQFSHHGIDAERLILEGTSPRSEYLATYQRVDIALDPFPYTGGTTSVEALWMGVPVLTLAGESFLSRQGVGFLMNAGLPEWIAADADDYVARAVLHACDLKNLAALRIGLRQQVESSPIFDAPRFAQHFEVALRGMWRKYCEIASDILPIELSTMSPEDSPPPSQMEGRSASPD